MGKEAACWQMCVMQDNLPCVVERPSLAPDRLVSAVHRRVTVFCGVVTEGKVVIMLK
jgi:hypothetical protein